jgi:hypothetical protein
MDNRSNLSTEQSNAQTVIPSISAKDAEILELKQYIKALEKGKKDQYDALQLELSLLKNELTTTQQSSTNNDVIDSTAPRSMSDGTVFQHSLAQQAAAQELVAQNALLSQLQTFSSFKQMQAEQTSAIMLQQLQSQNAVASNQQQEITFLTNKNEQLQFFLNGLALKAETLINTINARQSDNRQLKTHLERNLLIHQASQQKNYRILNTYKKQLHQLTEANAALNTQKNQALDALTIINDSMLNQVDLLHKSFSEKLQQVDDKLTKLESTLASVLSDNDKLKQQLSEQKNTFDNEMNSLKKQLSDSKRTLLELNKTQQSTSTQQTCALISATAEIDLLKKQNSTLNNTLKAQSSTLETSLKANDKLQFELAKKSGETKNLQDDSIARAKKYKKELSELSTKNQSLEKQIIEHSKIVSERDAQIAALNKSGSDLNDAYIETFNENLLFRDENVMAVKLSDLESVVDILKSRIVYLEKIAKLESSNLDIKPNKATKTKQPTVYTLFQPHQTTVVENSHSETLIKQSQ